ncbi:MAG: TonB-dependent receptor [Acidobacteriia bacterium]|nr:TonB-dependent receptor [Terriglobia bacterium]
MKTIARVTLGLRKAGLLLGLAVGMLLLCAPLFSQTNTGRIVGTVTDQSGAALAGATVTVRDVNRGVTRTLSTDSAGEYAAPNLEPGMYETRVEAAGFKSLTRQNIQVQVGQDIRLDLSLEIGSTSENVTVTGEVPLVNTTSSTLGGTLSNQTINDLPLNGRNFQKLLELRPGTYIFPGGGKWSQSTNGMRAEHNVYILDGIDTIESFSSQSVLNAAPVFGDATSILPIDAIQEFNTQQNPKAEYGWKPGGILNVGLKSGTNDLHGTAYAFGRTNALDAKNPFITPANPKQQTAIEDFGSTIGGPIRKDKLFFLAGYEGQRNTIGAPGTATVPTRTSLLANGAPLATALAQSLLDACNATTAPKDLSLKMAGLTYGGSLGTCAKDPSNAGLFQDGPSTSYGTPLLTGNSTLDNVLGKVDYHPSDKHTINGEYFFGQYSGLGPQGAVIHPYWETNTKSRVQIVGVHWTYMPNSTIVNEARWGLNRVNQTTYPGDCQNIGQPDLSYLNTGTGACGFPSITIGSFASLGCCVNFPKIQGPDMTIQGIDALSYLHGKHSFKLGVEIRHMEYNGATLRGSRGIFRFASLSSFFSGTTNTAQELLGSPQRQISDWGYAGYAQDDWRLTQRFTVNLGLRYETVTPIKDANNQLANFDPTLGFVQVGKQISEPYHQDMNNFSPRIGFAWDLRGDSKWVLRGGGSIIYVMEGFNVLVSQQGTTALTTGLNTIPTGALLNGVVGPGDITTGAAVFTPSQVTWTVAGPVLPSSGVLRCDSPLSASLTNNKPCPILAVNPNLRSPYVAAWNLSLQHSFTNDLSLEVAYIGNHGTKLVGIDDINAPALGSGWSSTTGSGATLACHAGTLPSPLTVNATCENLSRPFFSKFPYLSNINQVTNLDVSAYNGLQATLTQRPWHGVSALIGYTWSHAFEQNQGDWNVNLVSNPFNPNVDYGSASFDVRQRMTASVTYALPEKRGYAQMLEGWKINSVMNMQSALPWNVVDSTDDISGVGEFTDRWNFFGNPSSFSGLKSSSVPYFAGVSSADCLAKAQGLDAASTPLYPGYTNVASLTKYGCYVSNGAMMLPAAFGTFGTMGRNLFRGNGLRLWDMSVTKQIRFTERFNGQFRFEMFNILNMTQYALPSGPNVTQSNNNPTGGGGGNFGASKLSPDVAIGNPQVGSGGARSIQLGFKLIF